MKLLIIIMAVLIQCVVADAYYVETKVTAYPPLEEYTNSRPNETAFHREYGPTKHDCYVKRCGIAVSRLLEAKGFKHGCYVHVYGVTHCSGLFEVNDRTGWDLEIRADILFFKLQDAINFGVMQTRITLLWCE